MSLDGFGEETLNEPRMSLIGEPGFLAGEEGLFEMPSVATDGIKFEGALREGEPVSDATKITRALIGLFGETFEV